VALAKSKVASTQETITGSHYTNSATAE